jgi:uncharacterized protein YycO
MRVLFTRQDKGLTSIGSRLIRAFEGGLASHCGAVTDTGLVVDATWPKGVKAQSIGDFLHGRELVADITVPLPDEQTAQAWLQRALGQPYDLWDILSFLAWRDIGQRDRYVCSGLILRAMLAGGLPVRERHDRWGVRHLLILADARGAFPIP